MAIVPNKDGQGIKANGYYGEVDPSYCTPSVVGAVVPTSASLYASQVGVNTATGILYTSLAKGSTVWVEQG